MTELLDGHKNWAETVFEQTQKQIELMDKIKQAKDNDSVDTKNVVMFQVLQQNLQNKA